MIAPLEDATVKKLPSFSSPFFHGMAFCCVVVLVVVGGGGVLLASCGLVGVGGLGVFLVALIV